MQSLTISAIEIAENGIKYMTCTLTGAVDFENHPEAIYFLGDRYAKSRWNSDHNTVHYRTY